MIFQQQNEHNFNLSSQIPSNDFGLVFTDFKLSDKNYHFVNLQKMMPSIYISVTLWQESKLICANHFSILVFFEYRKIVISTRPLIVPALN